MRKSPWHIAGDVLPDPVSPAAAGLRDVLVGLLVRAVVAALSGLVGGVTALGLFG